MRCYFIIKEVDVTKLVFALNFNIIFCMHDFWDHSRSGRGINLMEQM